MTGEHMLRRETPLTVEVYAGCITKFDSLILNESPPIYSVVGIELIEHLDPEVLLGFEKTVFGQLHPPVVILTTPNADFNTFFGLPAGQFRHFDHRFEWTRAEFKAWCSKICGEYPSYTFTVEGIGEGPPETARLGHVSQMAVFRSDPLNPEPVLSGDYKGDMKGIFKYLKIYLTDKNIIFVS